MVKQVESRPSVFLTPKRSYTTIKKILDHYNNIVFLIIFKVAIYCNIMLQWTKMCLRSTQPISTHTKTYPFWHITQPAQPDQFHHTKI